jgi:hypothetical protein
MLKHLPKYFEVRFTTLLQDSYSLNGSKQFLQIPNSVLLREGNKIPVRIRLRDQILTK